MNGKFSISSNILSVRPEAVEERTEGFHQLIQKT